MPRCLAQSDQLTIAEVDNEQENEMENEKEKRNNEEGEKQKNEEEGKKEPAPIVNSSTGTLPKQNYNPILKAVKSFNGSKAPKRLRSK